MADGQTAAVKQKKKLPGWAGWLIGWAAVLAFSAGLVYFWRVIFFTEPGLPQFPTTLFVAGLLSLLYLALFLLSRLKGDSLCLKAALVVLVLGVLFCFATAPLQAPDEGRHFLRAWAVSQGHFTYNYDEEYSDDAALLAELFKAPMNHDIQYKAQQMAPARLAEYRETLAEGDDVAAPEPPIQFMQLPYYHQALFMAAARLLGFTALGQMYAARLANLLLYVVICYFAFRNAQKYRGLLFAFALLPLSLFMGASCSYDGLMLALCYLMVSYFCKEALYTRDIIVFLIALALTCYTKPNNIVLVALLLLIPKARWKSKWNPWLVAGAVAAVALLFWWGLGAVDNLLKVGYPAADDLPRGSGGTVDKAGQLQYVLSNPLRFIAVAVNSLIEGKLFLFDLGRLGSMDLDMPLVSGLSVVVLCVAMALGIQQREDTHTGAAVGLGLMAALYGAAVLAGMYVLETDLFHIRITGQQPRYFLPAFLLLFMLGSILLGRAVRPRLAGRQAAARTEAVTLWLAAGLALLAALLLFQSGFIGQWFPKSAGGWKLVNMFGWMIK